MRNAPPQILAPPCGVARLVEFLKSQLLFKSLYKLNVQLTFENFYPSTTDIALDRLPVAREREKEREYVSERMCVREREGEKVCVCVCVREK